MRVLVCGGRAFTNSQYLHMILDKFAKNNAIDCIIEGDAPGADRMAGYWARKNHIDNIKFPAKWHLFGPAAGPIRNKEMLEKGKPDIVIAFPGGKGTANMVAQATKANIKVIDLGG